MKKRTTLKYILLTSILLLPLAACAAPAVTAPLHPITSIAPASLISGLNMTYDPTRPYAAFIVINTQAGKDSLEGMKQRASGESYEIGPIGYYYPGTQNFDSMISSLTSNGQVKLVWIIGTASDISLIKAALGKTAYQGACRYAVIIKSVPAKSTGTNA